MQHVTKNQLAEHQFQVTITIKAIGPNNNGGYDKQIFLFSGRPETGDWLMSAYWKMAKLINAGLFKPQRSI